MVVSAVTEATFASTVVAAFAAAAPEIGVVVWYGLPLLLGVLWFFCSYGRSLCRFRFSSLYLSSLCRILCRILSRRMPLPRFLPLG